MWRVWKVMEMIRANDNQSTVKGMQILFSLHSHLHTPVSPCEQFKHKYIILQI